MKRDDNDAAGPISSTDTVLFVKTRKVYKPDATSKVGSHLRKLTPKKADDDHELQFISQEDVDVVFVTADKQKIGAHSYMLKARSSVLRAALKSKTGMMKVHEISAPFRHDVCYEMLRFIYASKVEHLAEFVEDLYKAALSYDLEDLKLVCENELITSLHKNNSISRYLLTLRNRNDALERKAMDMINKHARELIHTDDWAKLTPEHITKLYYSMNALPPPTKRIRLRTLNKMIDINVKE